MRTNPFPIAAYPARYEDQSGIRRRDYQREASYSDTGFSPWNFEYNPNPVIFPHLVKRSPSLQPLFSKNAESATETLTNDSESVRTPSLVDSAISPLNSNASSSSSSYVSSDRVQEDERSNHTTAKKPNDAADIDS